MGVSKQIAPDPQTSVSAGTRRRRNLCWAGIARVIAGPMLLLAIVMGLTTLAGYSPDTVMAQSGGTSDPLTLYDANDNGVIDADELITAASDYLAGRIARDLFVRVAQLYLSQGQSRATRSSGSSIPDCGPRDSNKDGMINRDEVIVAIRAFLFDGTLTRDQVIDAIKCYLFPISVAQSSYSFSVAENTSTGTTVGTVAAIGARGRVTYSITEGNDSGQFATTTSGAITVANPLDYEARPSHTLTVRAKDASGMWDDATVTVSVTDVFESRISVDIPSPVAGQTATMTAGTDDTNGASVTYRWQKLVNSRWISETSTSTTRSVSSNSPVMRIYRVVATVGSTRQVTSAPVSINWRLLSVGIDVSPEHPDSGDTVTLTASTNAPTGVTLTYTWQEKVSGSWSNLAATSPTMTILSSSQRVREFRLLVGYGASDTAESPSEFVVWDEPELFANLSTDMARAVASSMAYTTAETALLACVNTGRTGDDRFSSFNDVLANYDSDTEAVVESCEGRRSNPTTMFQTIEQESVTQLNILTAASTTYAALVRTPRGQDFAANAGSPHPIKLFASVMAGAATSTSASGSSARSETRPDPVVVERAGLNCLPYSGMASTTKIKMDTLNCLIFDTPHSFWTNNANQLRDRIDSPYLRADDAFAGPVDWLGYGDWRCTMAPQGPVVSCKKHDVAFASLQKFVRDVEQNEPIEGDANKLDEVWHPRNKALADSKFYVDILAHGCQEQSGFIATRMCRNLPNSAIAEIYYFAVSRVNNKGWPVTAQDLDLARARLDRIPPASNSQISSRSSNHAFVACENPVPTLSDVSLRDLGSGSLEWTWTHVDGCVPGIEIESVSMCATVQAGELVYFLRCEEATEGATSLQLHDSQLPARCSGDVCHVTAKLKPSNREYGGSSYTDDWAVTPSR